MTSRTGVWRARLQAAAQPRLWGALAVLAVAAGTGFATAAEPLVLAAAAVILAALVFAFRPDWLTLTVLALIYSNAVVIAGRYGVPDLAQKAFLLLLLLPLAYHILVRRQPLVITAAVPWLLAFLVVQAVGALFAVDTAVAVDRLLVFFFEGVLLFLAVLNAIRTPNLLRQCVWVLLMVGGCLGALSLVQTTTQTYDHDFLGFAQINEESIELRLEDPSVERPPPRVSGPIGEKNRYAQVLVVLIPLGIVLARTEATRVRRTTATVLTLFIFIGAALTFSRGAAVGLAFTLILMAALRYISAAQLLAITVVGVLLAGAFPSWVDRITSIGTASSLVSDAGSGAEGPDGSILGRAGANLAALRVFADHPVIGVGPGMFPLHYREQAIEVGLRVAETPRAAHNLYPHIAAETGILGIVCFMAIVLVTLRGLYAAAKRMRRVDPNLSALTAGLMFAVIAYLATGFFLHLSYQRYFWLLMALAAAGAAIGREAGPPASTHDSSEATTEGKERPAPTAALGSWAVRG